MTTLRLKSITLSVLNKALWVGLAFCLKRKLDVKHVSRKEVLAVG